MTKEQAFALRIKLDAVANGLLDVIEMVQECDRVDPTIRADLALHQALRWIGVARGVCLSVRDET